MNAKAPPSDQLHGAAASLVHQTVFRIADPIEEADHQTSAVPDLIGDTNANEHLDDGLQNFATYGPPRPAESMSTTGNHGPRARENAPNASTHPGDTDSRELQKEAVVFSSWPTNPAESLAKLPGMADSTPKAGWNTSHTTQHPGIRQNLRLRNHPRLSTLSIKVPSRDEVVVPSEGAPFSQGAEAVSNDGTAAGQCTVTNLTSTPPLQVSPPFSKETGGCERLIDGNPQETNDVLAVIAEKPGNSEDELTLKGDIVAKSMAPPDFMAQELINIPQTTGSRPSVNARCSSKVLAAESSDEPGAIPSPTKNGSKSCVTHVTPSDDQLRSPSSLPSSVPGRDRATEVRVPSGAVPFDRQGSRGISPSQSQTGFSNR